MSQLTERIHEMEETHICTNEELEATMQVIICNIIFFALKNIVFWNVTYVKYNL